MLLSPSGEPHKPSPATRGRHGEIFSGVVEMVTKWQGHQDSNPGPSDLESDALAS